MVLSTQEVVLLLAHARNLKDRAALSIAYDCGLRVSEIAHLKITEIDSARMLIRVEQSKGRKDRHVMLAPDLLDLLRQWWRVKRPRGWLFPGQQPGQPIATRQLTGPTMPRPSWRSSTSGCRCTRCGTALPRICWSGRSISGVIQVLLGHGKLDTTAVYKRPASGGTRH